MVSWCSLTNHNTEIKLNMQKPQSFTPLSFLDKLLDKIRQTTFFHCDDLHKHKKLVLKERSFAMILYYTLGLYDKYYKQIKFYIDFIYILRGSFH